MEVIYMKLKKWLSKDKSTYKLFDKEGFYIILFLCVCIVATTAIWVTKKNIDKIAIEDINPPVLEENKKNVDDFSIGKNHTQQPVIVVEDIDEKELVTDVATVSKGEVDKKEKKKEEKGIKPKTKETQQKEKIKDTKDIMKEESIKKEMKLPVIGEIGMNYAADTLVYSKTLDQYTTHYGIDIIAKENTTVVAALEGKVVEVRRDPKLGITVSLAHSGDMISKYANLSTDRLVKVGDFVEKGQTISGVGKTALFETLEEPHLHFEVLIDGKNVDPNKFLPKK